MKVYNTPNWGVPVALFLTVSYRQNANSFRTCEILLTSKPKREGTPFYVYVSLLTFPQKGFYAVKRLCNIIQFYRENAPLYR